MSNFFGLVERLTDTGFRYFLTLTSFQPLYGKLSDIFGRKPCLLFGYAIFGLGCLFCGLARNMNELIAARVSAWLWMLVKTLSLTCMTGFCWK